MSDTFYYEIVAASDGADLAAEVQAVIANQPRLVAGSAPYSRRTLPRQADLYALLVIASEGLKDDRPARERVAMASGGGFPVIPIVRDRATYDFRKAPLPEISARNAEAITDPDRLVATLLHHAGLELLDGGGQVFISYARADGGVLANQIRDELHRARIGQTVDVHAFPGGEIIQEEIAKCIKAADLVVVVDTEQAGRSRWVNEEIDLALTAHIQVIAVMPNAGEQRLGFAVPHVDLSLSGSPSQRVVQLARRLIARKQAFRVRVERSLVRLAQLRSWTVALDRDHWLVRQPRKRSLRVGCTAEIPQVPDVLALCDVLGPERGLLVAGLRPLPAAIRSGLEAAGRQKVAVASLPSLASRVPSRIARRPLKQQRIFLSAAMPSDPDEAELARSTLAPFVVTLTESLVELGVTLVFGGHPSVTPLVHEVITDLGGERARQIELHQARYWQRDLQTLKQQVREGPLFRHVTWHGQGCDPGSDVLALRDGMIRSDLTAGVFVGGKTTGFIGPQPGIQDEFERFGRACPGRPAFVLGLAGGAARNLVTEQTQLAEVLRTTADPDLAVALIVAELLGV